LNAACFATVITDAFGAALFYALLSRELGPGLRLKRLLRIGIASIGMGLTLLSIRHLNIFIAASIGGAVHLILAWFLPTFSTDERSQLLNVVNRIKRRLRPVAIRD
jgi:hypothetical protein